MTRHGIITDDWILSYASGALSEAHALVIASHCHYHPELQQKVQDAETIGGSGLSRRRRFSQGLDSVQYL